MAKDITKSEPQEPKSDCSECFNYYQQQERINAMDATKINIKLINNRTALIGDDSKVTICQRCFRRQGAPKHVENKTEVCVDGTGAFCHDGSTKSSMKRRRKRRKKPLQGQTAPRKCDVGGNSADSENSDSDDSAKFNNFLQYDSDD